MSFFRRRRKMDYGYYSSYNSRRRLRVDRVTIVAILGVFVVLGIALYFNLHRIQFMWKGYSFSTTNQILRSFDDEEENELLSHNKMDYLEQWIDHSRRVTLYDEYERFFKKNKNFEYDEVVEFIDYVFINDLPELKDLNYGEKEVWTLLDDGCGKKDFQYIIDNKLSNEQTKPYRAVAGYRIQKMKEYIKEYKECQDYEYAVNVVNYPFTISSNGASNVKYDITNPENILTLVKKGFYLNDYEPSDLVTFDEQYVAPSCDHPEIRQACADALMEMIKAGEKEGMHILLNSGYRSYSEQVNIYNEMEQKYGGAYAAEYVATPGASEHQTGLGVDLTAQSVVDKQRLVFGDTIEYKWVVENCQKYGFIVRFKQGTDNITGISHEPWHLRYVGKEVAQEINKNNWTLEEYCLYEGVMPKVKKD